MSDLPRNAADAGADGLPERLLSPGEVADACGLSRRAVYRAIDRGELPAARLCSRLRIRPRDLAQWIAERMEAPPVADPALRTGPVRTPVRGSLRAMLDQPQRARGGDR